MWEFICYSSSFDRNYYMWITIHLGYSNHQQMGDNTLWFSLVTQSWCPTLCAPWTATRQASLSITNSWSLLKLMSFESVMPSNHLILCCPLLLPPSASGSFPMSQFFTSGGQSTGVSVSASILLMNIQGWSSLGLTSWIFLYSKGLSRVFSKTTVQKHQFFGVQLYL